MGGCRGSRKSCSTAVVAGRRSSVSAHCSNRAYEMQRWSAKASVRANAAELVAAGCHATASRALRWATALPNQPSRPRGPWLC